MRLLLTLLVSLWIPYCTGFECITCNANSGDDDTNECVEQVEECDKGVESCSMVAYVTSADNKVHMRKFCTSSGTPIYQYLLFFPGSSLCQNIETSTELVFPKKLNIDLLEEDLASLEDHGEIDSLDDEVLLNTLNSTLENRPGKNSKPRKFGPPGIRPPSDFDLNRAKRVRRSSPAAPPAPPQSQKSNLLCVCSTERCNSGAPEQVLARAMLNNFPFTVGPSEKVVDDSTIHNFFR